MEKEKLAYSEIQTPTDVWAEILRLNPIDNNIIFFEPFAGDGNLLNQVVSNNEKEWCEITKGRDIFDYDFTNSNVEIIYTNPPFKCMINGKYKNCVYYFLEYFMTKLTKLHTIGFLMNAKSFQSITPKRMAKLNRLGFYISNITLLNCSYWYGLYYFVLFERDTVHNCIQVIEHTFTKHFGFSKENELTKVEKVFGN